ncbi:hypothetical protein A5906_24490 [Bradyrhizobium sacchari]|uniref:Uncharacterized protein n=1 Tax=Bradyrhizobium sacchari TaxID=1399419 RepID=A0A560K586_9BRAD|nr:hypothetical protein [Bradyrhizobium sacchari]OPY99988.1 hypothetical protein A5906_24490 [Bradyrhizobium sacchari]TWB54057.1 hypothetical protein FBZ94_108344 [Bradyrhizobium sacchari]TWB78505.1 hypothetical protein FBZ95_103344 [Bradyrhizobium sacchari]
MKWIRERDELIAQTLAFVQSVTGKKDELHPPEHTPAALTVTAEILTVQAVSVEAEPPPVSPPEPQARPVQIPPPRPGGDFRSEMQARIANFRKHQERFEREREEYCAATLTKLRAALRDSGPLPPTEK